MRRPDSGFVALGMLFVCAGLAQRVGLWLNLSPSMPIGFYRSVAHDSAALTPGTIVAVCLPDALAHWGRARGYLKRGRCRDGIAPIGKPIFAIAGDTVTLMSTGLARNGAAIAPNTRPLDHDRAGFALPRIPDGQYPVLSRELWLVSTHTGLSWDSRYFGPIPSSDVIAILHPIWVEDRGLASPASNH